MLTANSYEQICKVLSDGFKNRYPHKESIITGIVLARPDLKYSQDEIVPNINSWFHASDSYTDFFYGGYLDGNDDKYKDLKEVGKINGEKWCFSDELYNEFVNEFRSISKWKPSGGADLILTNARYNSGKTAYLDFSSALSIDLKKAENDKLFVSVSHFFQDIFNFAQNINHSKNKNPVSDLSNSLGLKLGTNTLKEALLLIFPDSIKEKFRAAFNVAVTDISK